MRSAAATERPVLELREVKRHFGGIRAVDGVTLTIGEGAVVALIGPNGAGKSTLFALMMGELRPTDGEIFLDGLAMQGVSTERRSRLGIGRTFQTPRLFAGLSVVENVKIALLARRGASRVSARAGRGNLRKRLAADIACDRLPDTQPCGPHVDSRHSPREEPTDGVLAEVGLLGQTNLTAASLSQGQRKRLELAMVLALEPRLLLLDEPTAGMGTGERATIMELVMGAVRRRGLTMVFCEHDMETVFAHAGRVVVMDRGTLVADGSPAQVRSDPLVQQIYLGRQVGREGL